MSEFRRFLFSMREWHRQKGNFCSVWCIGWLLKDLSVRKVVSRVGFLEFLVGEREFYCKLGYDVPVWCIDDLLVRQGVGRVSKEVCSF